MVEHTKRVLHLEGDGVAHIPRPAYGIYRMEKIHSKGRFAELGVRADGEVGGSRAHDRDADDGG